MAQVGQFYLVRSDKDTDFIDALAQNAGIFASLDMVPAIGVGGPSRAIIRSIQVISDQQLAWELWFFDRITTAIPSDMDLDGYRGRWGFQAADGAQIAGAGSFHYSIDGLLIPYEDVDYRVHELANEKSQLHIVLVNRSAVAKNAGATGEIVVQVVLEETMGW